MLTQVYAPTTNAKEAEVEWFYDDLQDLLELTPAKDVPLIIGGLECKSSKSRDTRSNRQVWLCSANEAGQRLTAFCQENTVVIENISSSNNTGDHCVHGHHQMVSSKIRLIIFFAVKDGEALHSEQKQDWELTVAHIMNCLLQNSDLNWRK